MSRVRVVVAIVAVLAGSAVAVADRLVLHSQDSITIDGTRYTCDDTSRRGVQLAPGDHINAGGWQLHCDGDHGDTGSTGTRPTARTITAQSHVDTACIAELFQTTNGHASANDMVHLAEGCRVFEIGGQCTATTTQPDGDCFTSLNQLIAGTLSDQEIVRVQRACQRVEATCPAYPNKVASKVDLDCVTKLYQASTARPTTHGIASWLDSCRDHAPASCIAVGGKLDHDCVTKAYSINAGAFSATEAAAVSRACRVLELRCQ